MTITKAKKNRMCILRRINTERRERKKFTKINLQNGNTKITKILDICTGNTHKQEDEIIVIV